MIRSAVETHLDAHAKALVDGNVDQALGDLTDELRANAGPLLAELPSPVASATLLSVALDHDDWVARIRYAGVDEAVTVESRWREIAGRLRMTEAGLVTD